MKNVDNLIDNGPFAVLAQKVRKQAFPYPFQGTPDDRRLLALAEDIREVAKRAYHTPGAGVAWGHLRDAADILERKVQKSKME